MREEQARNVLEALQQFYLTSLDALLKSADSGDIVLPLFTRVARQVPAYTAFLTENDIDAAQVNSLESFRQLPMMTKENYLRRHELADLC
jgi:phenylacetate-CoA ligase